MRGFLGLSRGRFGIRDEYFRLSSSVLLLRAFLIVSQEEPYLHVKCFRAAHGMLESTIEPSSRLRR